MNEERECLEALLSKSIAILEQSDSSRSETDLNQLLHGHPELAPKVRKALDRLGLLGLVGPLPEEENLPDRLGDFERGNPIGGGGMGLVFRARQTSLNREVALKLIRPEQALLPRARERFRREASTVAGLSHPGIIKVHAFGEQRGVPYIAMDLIHGCTLAEALEILKEKRPCDLKGSDLFRAIQEGTRKRFPEEPAGSPTPGMFQGSWIHACISIIKQAAKTLAYTHRQGLVHRDVKPSNIMLTPDGQVLLFDFGLISAGNDSTLTRSGSPLGSPAYMAPEVLKGKEADERADIYGLGISLYEFLTLKRPYRASSLAGLQENIKNATPLPPRKINPKIPRDLETVCLHAMDPDPLHRYPSMDAYIEDLERLERNETILARRPSSLLRLQRWRKRHPALSTSLFFLALIGVGTPTSLWLSQRSANIKVTKARDLAEKNLEMALSAVEQFLASWGRNEVQENPILEGVGKDLLKRGVQLYTNYLKETAGDPRVLGRRGRAGVVLADLYLRQGKIEKAKTTLQNALAAFTSILDKTKWKLSAANGRIGLARILRIQNQAGAAKREIGQAMALLAQCPPSRDAMVIRGNSYAELGALALSSGESLLAEKNYQAYLRIFAELGKKNSRFKTSEGQALHRLGLVATQLGKRTEATSYFEKAKRIFQNLRKKSPWNLVNRILLSETLVHLGQLAGWGKDSTKAKRNFEEARQILLGLKADLPQNLELKDRLARLLSKEAFYLSTAGEGQLAQQRFLEADKEFQEMGSSLLKNHHFAEDLLLHRARYGNLLIQKGDLKGANTLFEGTLKFIDPLAPQRSFRERSILSKIQNSFTILLRKQGKLKEAETLATMVRDTRRSLLRDHPTDPGLMAGLGTALHNLANIRRQRGHPEDAISLLRKAISWKRKALKDTPQSHGRVHSLGISLQDLALDLSKAGLSDEAKKTIKEAILMHERAVQIRPKNPRYRRSLHSAQQLKKKIDP